MNKSRRFISLLVLICVCGPALNAVHSARARNWQIPPLNYPFSFPRDHGSHPDYRIEWWYITGHLTTDSSRNTQFGYQATFFRIGLTPGEQENASDGPVVSDDHIFMAHMALTDISGETFHHEEKLNRRGWDAWADTQYLNTANGNWSLIQDTQSDHFEARLRSTIGADIEFDFTITSPDPPVIFGKDGVSIKGADPSARSLYITFPRLKTTGTLRFGKQNLPVSGTSWMDHEISSSQLDENQVGWNWASILLNDGRSIMVYMMRQKDQSMDPHSSYNLILPGNETVHEFTSENFSWKPIRNWTNPDSGHSYPVESEIHFTLTDTGDEADSNPPAVVRLVPRLDNQEMLSKISKVQYWEGACDVLDESGQSIGKAYVELTGYDQALTPLMSAESLSPGSRSQ